MEEEVGGGAEDVVEFAEEFEIVAAKFFLEFVEAKTGVVGAEIADSAKFVVSGDSLFFSVFDVFGEGKIVGAAFGQDVVVAAIEVPGFVAVKNNHVSTEDDVVAVLLLGFLVALKVLLNAS